jgi:molybdopterin converting factor small subunit
MITVKVELWMELGKELRGDFKSPSKMRSILQICVEEKMTIGRLFGNLSERYRSIEEKIFDQTNGVFHSRVVVLFNDSVISPYEICEKVLKDGDKITILPIYTGG